MGEKERKAATATTAPLAELHLTDQDHDLNIQMLGRIRAHDKLWMTGGRLELDPVHILRPASRCYNQQRCIDMIPVVAAAVKHCVARLQASTSTLHRLQLYGYLDAARKGLTTLAAVYAADSVISVKLDSIIRRVDTSIFHYKQSVVRATAEGVAHGSEANDDGGDDA